MGKRIQKINLDALSRKTLELGFVGEHDHTRIEISCNEVLWDYPDATVSMVVQSPSGALYPVTPVRDEDKVVWTVTDSDVAYPGTGSLHITFLNGTEVVKSEIGSTRVKRSIVATGEAPDPIQSWIDSAEETAHQVALDAKDEVIELIQETAEEAIESIPADYTELSNDVDDLKTGFNELHEVVRSKNIYDASIETVPGWLRDTGAVDTSGTGASFATTYYIPVEKNTNYIIANERLTVPGSTIGSRILMALYDAEKSYIGNTFQNVVNVSPMVVTFNSGNAAYLRVSTLPKHLGLHPENNALIIQKGSTLTGYTSYWVKDVSTLSPSAASASDNILFGKKFVACGDSLTAGDFTGYTDNEGYTGMQSDAFSLEYSCYKTYPYWIATRNNMVLVNEGINGSTMALSKTYVDDNTTPIGYRSPFSYQRYMAIPEDADYITLWFGVNDKDNTYLGTIDDDDNTTFYGAWNVVLPYLVEHHPNAKIGIVITFGIPDSPFTQAVREVAKKWGIPYYDFPRGEQSPIIIRNKDTGYAVDSDMVDMRLEQFRVAVDNNHPNLVAHKFESTCLEAWLRSL